MHREPTGQYKIPANWFGIWYGCNWAIDGRGRWRGGEGSVDNRHTIGNGRKPVAKIHNGENLWRTELNIKLIKIEPMEWAESRRWAKRWDFGFRSQLNWLAPKFERFGSEMLHIGRTCESFELSVILLSFSWFSGGGCQRRKATRAECETKWMDMVVENEEKKNKRNEKFIFIHNEHLHTIETDKVFKNWKICEL